jgi:hypothetical protein
MKINTRKIWRWTDWFWIGTGLALLCRLLLSCQVQRQPGPGCPGERRHRDARVEATGDAGIYRVELRNHTWIITDDTTLKGGRRP